MPQFISSLRSRLVLIVSLAILPAILLMLYTGIEERRNAASKAQEDAEQVVQLASMHQARMIDEVHQLLMDISREVPSHLSDRAEASAYLAKLLQDHPHYLNFGVIGANGQLLFSALPFQGELDLSDRDYFQRALKEGRFTIGTCRIGRITGKVSIGFAHPVRDEGGEIRGVIFAAVDMAWLSDLVKFVKLPRGGTLTVVDRSGAVIARYPDPEQWVGKIIPDTEILRAILDRDNEGLTEAIGLDGVNRLYAFAPLGDPPHSAFLYTGIPTDEVYAAANRALVRNLIALGCVSILALLAAHLFGHLFVMRPLDALVSTARRITSGDLGARTGIASECSEIRQLGHAFDEMAESLERRGLERDQMEEALRQSEAKYRTLVEQIPLVTYIAALDESRRILYISPQVESLLGFDQDDFSNAPNTWSKALHPEDRQRVLDEVTRCRTDNDLFVCEYRMVSFNGYLKWIRDEAVMVQGLDGEPLFIQGVMIDITEQKKAEEALRKAHDELELRVSERTEELARANEELKQSTEKLKFFAYSVVHDLKSPAIGAYGLTRLLDKQYAKVLDHKAREYCAQIMRASEHIADLVEKINVFIATKESPMTLETFTLDAVLDMLRQEFEPKLNGRSISWVQPEAPIEIKADKLALLRVFRNYVDNALKYGGEHLSAIRIGYQESEDEHIFSVSDDGQGVNEADAEKIFQMFQRTCASNEVEGAGLGLAIVKEVAERHGGSVWLDSEPGRGTTFYISISKELNGDAMKACEVAA